MKDETCVCCGVVIPEGKQVCPNCERKKLTNEEIIKDMERYIELGYTSTPAEVWLDLIRRLQNDYSNLKERYVKVLGLNEKVIAEQKVEIEWLAKVEMDLIGKIADQKAEIERLTEEHAELQKQVDELKEENKKLYKENTTLIAGSILERKDISKDTAKEIFEKIFEVLCCFTTQGKSKGYAEGFIDCLEEVDERIQKLAQECNIEVE